MNKQEFKSYIKDILGEAPDLLGDKENKALDILISDDEEMFEAFMNVAVLLIAACPSFASWASSVMLTGIFTGIRRDYVPDFIIKRQKTVPTVLPTDGKVH